MLNDKYGTVNAILDLTGRRGDSRLIPQFTTTPLCGESITGVLNGTGDDFTVKLDSGDFKTMAEEPVGSDKSSESPGEGRVPSGFGPYLGPTGRKGPVLEFRQPLFNAAIRHPPERWNDFVDQLARSLQRVNQA